MTEKTNFRVEDFVTNTDDNVYVLTENIPSSVAAAAMARLSRSEKGLRQLLEDEFQECLPKPSEIIPLHVVGSEENSKKEKPQKDVALLKRVISEYGDDSVQQLAGFYVVVDDASNLLSKALERGRIGVAYLEKSSRYVTYDSKRTFPGEDLPRYLYHIPATLHGEERISYCENMDEIFRLYSHAVRSLMTYLSDTNTTPAHERNLAWRNSIRAAACDLARGILPAATLTNVGIYGSAQALENLVMHLLGGPLVEMQTTGKKILQELRKVAPIFFERADLPERGGDLTRYFSETRKQYPPDREFVFYAEKKDGGSAVVMDFFFPENEDDPSLYLPCEGTETFSETVKRYAGNRKDRRQKPGRLFENYHYHFKVCSAYAEFRDLQRHRMIEGIEWSLLEPTSYTVHPTIVKAGLEDLFKQAWEVSKSLYQKLLTGPQGGPEVAQYAVLFCSKITWEFGMNLREAIHMIELRTTPQGHPSYRKLCQEMYFHIKSVHPTLASSINFVNLNDAPELSRLQAESRALERLERLERLQKSST